MAEPSYTVTLTWAAYPHPELVTSLTVKRDGTLIATLTGTDTTFIDDGTTAAGAVDALTTYQYEVDVNFNNGCPTRAALVDVDVGCYAPAPTGLTATDDGDGGVYLAWTIDTVPLLKFVISYGTVDGGPYPTTIEVDPSNFSYHLTGLVSGTTYYFIVKAFDFDNCGGTASNQASATPTSPPQDFGVDWEPPELDLPSMMGLFAYTASPNSLAGITNLSIGAVSNPESYDFENCPDLVTLSFPNLTEMIDNSYFFVTTCPNLTTINMPSFVNFHANTAAFAIDSCPALTTVNLPLFADATGLAGHINDIFIENCSSLVVLSLPSFVPKNSEKLLFANNALNQASVDAILAQAVANVGYISGEIDLSGGTNATPSGAGLANKATLIGRGVTVTTN